MIDVNNNDGIKGKLQIFFAIITVILIIYNIYSGLIIGEIGIPGIFTIKFRQPEQPKQPEQSFLQMIEGKYTLDSWVEASGPVTLWMEVKDGTLEITKSGEASWELWIQERGEFVTPHPRIKCKGRVIVESEQLIGVPGEGNYEIDWTSDIMSIWKNVWLSFGGWATGESDMPFNLSIEIQSDGTKILQMRNEKGTFTWIG